MLRILAVEKSTTP